MCFRMMMYKSDMMQNDGGYYAIKGFSYQFDKAILELLNCEDGNKSIYIEGIQDVNSDNFVIQVKYREKGKFMPSEITLPVIQLIEEFRNDVAKDYILYAHFNNLNGYDDFVIDRQITINNLDKILGKRSAEFSTAEKEAFVLKFFLDFSPDFQIQFEQVIAKLKENGFGSSYDEIIFHYSSIECYLQRLIINNPDKEKRNCTKGDVIEFLKNGKKVIYESGLRVYRGETAYFRYIKRAHFSENVTDNFERFILIELHDKDSVSDIKSVISRIKKRFYKNHATSRGQLLKSGAPYVFLRNISDANLKQLKTELRDDGFGFRDGYDFLNADFCVNSIKKSSTIHDGICLKFINKEDDLLCLILEKLSKTKEIYQFYITNSLFINADIKSIEIQIKNLSDINNLL